MYSINSAYHYYLSVYGNNASSRYDTHKKSELRNVYNNIVRVNKESPIYKLQNDQDIPKFLIDIKENARQVKNVISSLSDRTEGLESSFQKKIATSSDENIVSAAYIGDYNAENTSQNFDIEVRRLATPQTNTGNFLNSHELDFSYGNHSFDLFTMANSYEFQYTVNPEDTNRSVQEKLARLFNSSNVGLTAEVISDEKGRSALKLTSKQTGINENKTALFDIKPKASAESFHALELLGIHQITSPAENSSFLLNGTEHSSYSNTLTIGKAFELTLHGVSPENTSTQIGFKTSVDTVADNLQNLVDAYNNFISTGERQSNRYQGNRLLRDLRSVSFSHRNDLESAGLIVADNGSISIDKNLLSDTIETNDFKGAFSVLNSFKNALSAKADYASIDPIQYVDKTIVTYKKPGQNYPSPYHSSLYSGMLLDRIC